MLQVKCRIERWSRNNKLVEEREFLSRSFVVQFLGIFHRIFGDTTVSLNTIKEDVAEPYPYDGSTGWNAYQTRPLLSSCMSGKGEVIVGEWSTRSDTGKRSALDWVNQLAADKMGIVIGTGSTGETTGDYRLETRIASGNSAGEMDYFACGGGSAVVSGGDCYFDLSRSFVNNSGGTITVEEIGIYANSIAEGHDLTYCILRDTETVAVLNGEFLKIRYRFKVTA